MIDPGTCIVHSDGGRYIVLSACSFYSDRYDQWIALGMDAAGNITEVTADPDVWIRHGWEIIPPRKDE